MGPKFVIVFSGVDEEGSLGFLQDLKNGIEDLSIEVFSESEQNDKKKKYVNPKVNMVITTYYKGTALESVNKKLEEYLDDAGVEESDINEI